MIPSRTPMAKADFWKITDAERRKLGERTGLETRVVLAVNDARWLHDSPLACRVAKLTR